MRFKKTPELCYIAGLTSHANEPERSQVGIKTQNDELAERFVKYALKLGVDSQKIMIVEDGSFKHFYFYHSKLSRQIREVLKERSNLPVKNRELAIWFIAGTFDGSGHVIREKVTISRLERSDELLLERMGVHSVNSKIMNIGYFIALIKKQSILARDVSF